MNKEKEIMAREMVNSEVSIFTVKGEDRITWRFEGSALGIGATVIRALTDLCNKDQALREVIKCGMMSLLDEIKEAESNA